VKARYSRGLKAAVQLAKGHVRYAVHRCDERGERQYREVWDRDGRITKLGAYERLDQVREHDYVYRLMLSPHPEHLDGSKRLDLRSWTHDIMAELERGLGRSIGWFAVSHEHIEHRHVHVVAVTSRRLDVRHFRSMRDAGDRNALDQQRDQSRQPGRQAAIQHKARDRDRDREVNSIAPRGGFGVPTVSETRGAIAGTPGRVR
jgi:hypothetical protein